MTIWMAWTLAMSLLVALGAALLARSAWYVGLPRRFVWAIAIVCTVAAPLCLPARGVAVTRRFSPWATQMTKDVQQRTSRAAASGDSAMIRIQGSGSTGAPARMQVWIVSLWALWSIALLVALSRAALRLRKRRSTWTEVDSDIGHVFAATNDGPAVIGWIRPRIVVPSWVLAADAPTRTLILSHELEHVRAGDTRLLLLAELARCAFPWNAALWWMSRRLRLAIELDCDARVIRTSGTPHAYGVMLLTVSQRVADEGSFASLPLAPRLDLERRLEVIATKRRRHPILASIPYAAIALIALISAAATPRPGFPSGVRSAPTSADSDLVRVGYVHRKETTKGIFLDSADIDRTAARFSDVFRIGSASDCLNSYIDGIAWTSATDDIDDFIRAADVLAVEAYRRGNAPPQFAGKTERQCQAFVIWTKAIRQRRASRT